jgi:hypothetical protein
MGEKRERAIHAAVIEMSMFSGNLEMKVRKAIERYEFIMSLEDHPEGPPEDRTVLVSTPLVGG